MAGKAARKNIGGGTWYSGGNSKVAAEAKEKNKGGAVKAQAVKRKYGGRTVGAPSGATAAPRLDKRARGGGIPKFATGGGADKNPFSSAGAGMRGGKK